jgi:outer membrane lipoprotein-sorting protein
MRPTEEIEKLVENVKIETNPQVNKAVFAELCDELDKIEKEGPASDQPGVWRIIMNSKMTKLAAAAVIIIAVLVGLTITGPNNIAWADVVEPILNAKTLIVDIVVGDEESSPVMHDIVVDSRIRRTISNIPGTVMVIDTEGGKILALDENGKSAMYIDIEGPLAQGTEHFVRFLREVITKVQNTPDFEVEQLEQREIDGRKVVGLSAGGPQENITIWADVETKVPVKVELRAGNTPFVLKNFEFDVDVDESLVSMEIPAGYAAQQAQPDFSDATEEDFVQSLRIYTQVLGEGRFPEKVDTGYMMQQVGLLPEKVDVLDCSEEEKGLMCMAFAKGLLFIQMFDAKGVGQWHYAGAGVELGDNQTAIFWYHPKDSQDYRVIYGDLTVKDVPSDQLPK